jgi:hypothetical protein
MDIPHFVYPFLDCFHDLAIVDRAAMAMNTGLPSGIFLKETLPAIKDEQDL